MESLIVIGACCIPLALGAIGFVAWGGGKENTQEIPEQSDLIKPVQANRTLGQRLRRWRKEGQ